MVDDCRHVDGTDIEVQLVRVGPRQCQDVIDQRAQAIAFGRHHGQVLSHLVIDWPAGFEQRLDVGADTRDRRTQLVGGIHDQLAPALLGALGAYLLAARFRLGRGQLHLARADSERRLRKARP